MGFLSNTGPDPLRITKLPSQHSALGYHLYAIESSFKWRFAGRPTMALYWFLDPPSPNQLKNVVKGDPPSDKNSSIRVWWSVYQIPLLILDIFFVNKNRSFSFCLCKKYNQMPLKFDKSQRHILLFDTFQH